MGEREDMMRAGSAGNNDDQTFGRKLDPLTLFSATVDRVGRPRRRFLIRAASVEEARDKFLVLAAREHLLGHLATAGEPLFLFGDEVSYGVVEFEAGDIVEV